VRLAQNRKPATYTCPFCRKYLAPMTPHALIAPEGDMSRRRHAHMECVRRAQLPSYDDWRKTQPREPGFFARLLRRSQ
jgi:hypothetical protein